MPPGAIRSRDKILDEILLALGGGGADTENLIMQMMRLSTDDDVVDMNVDAAAAAVNFGWTNDRGVIVQMNRLNLYYVMQSNPHKSGFGTNANPLANGISLLQLNTDGSVKFDFTNGQGIKRNPDWYLMAGVDAKPFFDSDTIPVRWTLGKTGTTIKLHPEERFQIGINDNLEAGSHALTLFKAMLQGFADD